VKVHELKRELWLPRPVAEIFPFFADAANLESLTPPWLNFRILSPRPIPIRLGTLIDYRIVVHGIPFRWQSEITAWEPPHRFVDEQRRGPYRIWRHEHRFLERDGGTSISDTVHYAVLFDPIVNRWLVRPDIEGIFDFRTEKMRELFGEAVPQLSS
jgi:ligand-binding SRPBCC domain-containing protein